MKNKLVLVAAVSAATVVGSAAPASAQRLASEPVGTVSPTATAEASLDPVSALLHRIADAGATVARRAAEAMPSPRVVSTQVGTTSPHVVSVSAARVRTRPVDGSGVRVLYRGARIGVACQRYSRDGYWWGLITYPVQGWIRHDLYLPNPWTGSGAGAWHPVPRC